MRTRKVSYLICCAWNIGILLFGRTVDVMLKIIWRIVVDKMRTQKVQHSNRPDKFNIRCHQSEMVSAWLRANDNANIMIIPMR